MNATILSVMAVLGIFTTQLAHSAEQALPDRPMVSVWDARLSHIELDTQLPYRDEIRAAAVEINYQTGKASLVLARKYICPRGSVCAEVMPAPFVVALPITNLGTDDCGSRLLRASIDTRSETNSRGSLKQLVIRDNTANHCESVAKSEATEVSYETESRNLVGVVNTHSSFSGEALRPVFVEAAE